jgi:hypothetical protein
MINKQLFLTSAMAATLTGLQGCSSGNDWDDGVYARNTTRVCVDQNGKRVADNGCHNRPGFYGGSRWFYVGRGSRVPYIGDSLGDKRHGFNGSYNAKPGAAYDSAPGSANMTRSAAVARGGLGSSSRSFGGGRS